MAQGLGLWGDRGRQGLRPWGAPSQGRNKAPALEGAWSETGGPAAVLGSLGTSILGDREWMESLSLKHGPHKASLVNASDTQGRWNLGVFLLLLPGLGHLPRAGEPFPWLPGLVKVVLN